MSLAAHRDEGHDEKGRIIHPLVVRVTHWVNAVAIFVMVMSGWKIYDASPIFNFMFPRWMTLGGWLGGALGWHFAAMWLLVGNGLVYVLFGIASGHFRHDFLPLSPAAIWRDFWAALTFRLAHRLGAYNAVQRLLYVGVILLGIGVVISGLAIWKPVQFQADRPFRHDGRHRRLYRRPSDACRPGSLHAAADDHRPRAPP
jgi:thiosulfate reductase cytochrome b subunit